MLIGGCILRGSHHARKQYGEPAYLKTVLHRNSPKPVREIKNGKANLPVIDVMQA